MQIQVHPACLLEMIPYAFRFQENREYFHHTRKL
jgi:hypothetical protein